MSGLVFGLALLFFISSCGFINNQTSFQLDSQNGDPGKGGSPSLRSRIESNPRLKDKNCDENDRCQETCREIYEERDSYRNCDRLKVGQVSALEDVFYYLVQAESGDDGLEEIDEDDLQDYLNLGLDGWMERVLPRVRDSEEKLENTLDWLVQESKNVVPILQKEDPENTILEELILEYCNYSAGACSNDLVFTTECGKYNCKDNILDAPLFVLSEEGILSSCSVSSPPSACTVESLELAKIEPNYHKLFRALFSVGKVLFYNSTREINQQTALVLANGLLEKVCREGNSGEFNNCINAFYCALVEQIFDASETDFNSTLEDLTSEIGREITLNCGAGG